MALGRSALNFSPRPPKSIVALNLIGPGAEDTDFKAERLIPITQLNDLYKF